MKLLKASTQLLKKKNFKFNQQKKNDEEKDIFVTLK